MGPDGHRGTLLYWHDGSVDSFGYFPDSQEWDKCAKGKTYEQGAFWIGYTIGRPVEPHDLLKREYHDGTAVTLNDGNEWLIPSAGMLPKVWGIDQETGTPCAKYDERFREFCEESEKYAESICSMSEDGSATVSADWWQYCLTALSINYRIIPDVASKLGLFTTCNLFDVAMATCDRDFIVEILEQKKVNALSAIPDG